MRNKEKDVPYCGVDKEKIQNAKPTLNEEVFRYLHLYLTERHEIYKKKEIQKLPAPWTTDDVLGKYRFTNVRRELDRESRWLIENVSENDELSLEDKIYNSILFRTYNKSSTSEIIGMPFKNVKDLDIETIRPIIEEYSKQNPKYVWFTPAFNTGGLKFANAFPKRISSGAYLNQPRLMVTVIHRETKEELEMTYKEARDFVAERGDECYIEGLETNIPMRMIHLLEHQIMRNISSRLLECETQEDVFNVLLEIHGFSDFLAYQVFVDLTYIPEFPFSENEFVIAGPGCRNGLNMVFDDYDGMNHSEAMFWLRDNFQKECEKRGLVYTPEELYDHLPEHDRVLNVMSIENAHCELQKLVKAKREEGRPRVTYKPTVEQKKEDSVTDLF